MNKYYRIKCWNSLFKLWIYHDDKRYKTLQAAQEEVSSYKANKLGVKFQIIKIEILK